MGVLARGTDFISKGFSVGSRVYWWRDFSRPGTDTDRPDGRRHRLFNKGNTFIHFEVRWRKIHSLHVSIH
jgi:hypothetical protein